MNWIETALLGGILGAIALLLACSRVTRAIFWDTLRHPFRRSRVTIRNGQIVVVPDDGRLATEKQGERSRGTLPDKKAKDAAKTDL